MIKPSIVQLSQHNQGVRIVKSLVSKFIDDQKISQELLEMIETWTEMLIQSDYGNYLVKHVLDIYKHEKTKKILNKILARVIAFSI